MNAIEKLSSSIRSVAAAGSRRVEDVRIARRRSSLLEDLGELTHRRHCGVDVADEAVAALLADLDGLESDTGDSSATAEVTTG